MVFRHIVGAIRGAHEPDQALERIGPVAWLLAKVPVKRLTNVGCLGATGARGELLERSLSCIIDVQLLSPHTSEYTSVSKCGAPPGSNRHVVHERHCKRAIRKNGLQTGERMLKSLSAKCQPIRSISESVPRRHERAAQGSRDTFSQTREQFREALGGHPPDRPTPRGQEEQAATVNAQIGVVDVEGAALTSRAPSGFGIARQTANEAVMVQAVLVSEMVDASPVPVHLPATMSVPLRASVVQRPRPVTCGACGTTSKELVTATPQLPRVSATVNSSREIVSTPKLESLNSAALQCA